MVVIQVEVLKGLAIDGPIILPRIEDVPYLARPLTGEERDAALNEAKNGDRITLRNRRRLL